MTSSSHPPDGEPAYKVLCVDDEQRVLDALRRHLREHFSVFTATSGAEALQILGKHKDLAVVVSDMRMPEMDGATLLRHTRAVRPSAVRILLTGQADMAAAIKAINEGQIFRFLTKPCAPEQFLSVMNEAIRQHELIVAERVLLQRTLVGAIKALTDIMTLVSPAVVGRAQRLKRRVSALVNELNLEDRWQVEIAALLSYLGQVSLPDFLTHKLSRGRELDPEETIRVENATRAANRLIGHVPRLEPVSAILTALNEPLADEDSSRALGSHPSHVQVLRLAMEAERLEAQGLTNSAILETLQASGDYPAILLAALRTALKIDGGTLQRAEIPVGALALGMVLDEDIKTTRDILIAPRGCEVTASFIEHIGHFTKQLSKPTITVLQQALATDSTDEVPGLAAAAS
jgi:CheY-like chemotaxis protein